METKEIKTTFYLSEFEEEEKWLQVQHSQGWKLAGICGKMHTQYKFEKCPDEEWIYQLDFRGNDVKKDEYIQLFADCGWEFIFQHDRWFYFRKKKEPEDADIAIFSDRDSKINMCERIINGRLRINVGLFGLSCAIVLITVFTDVFRSGESVLFPVNTWVSDFLKAAIPWIGIGLLLACSYSFREYGKIKKRIDTLKNPIK
jgi:hypothetical protein